MPLFINATRWLAAAARVVVRPQWKFGAVVGSALFHHVQKIVESRFLLIWLLLAVLIAICGYALHGFAEPAGETPVPIDASNQAVNSAQFTLIDGLAGVAFLLFFCFYIFVIFHKEDFAYYDDDVMTEYSVQGVNYAPPIWPDVGRFFPLADQEFNGLRYVTRSPVGYHSLAVVELALLLVVLYFVLERLRLRYRFLIMAAAMLGPSFIIPFTGFVYPERNVLFWLAIMVLCLQRYAKTNSALYFVGCLLAVHCALYYKETVVLFVVAYVAVRVFLKLRARAGKLRSSIQIARENLLSIGILAVSSIYVVLFLIVMLPHHSSSYIAEHSEPLKDVVLAYLHFDWLPLLLFPVLAVRFARFFLAGERLDLLWDSIGVGAAIYYITIVALHLNAGNYMAPADLFALLYLANIAATWLRKPSQIRIAVAALAIVCLMMHDAAFSTFRMVERKETISTKVQLAEFLGRYVRTVKSGNVELFFPYANAFHLMGFSDYLRYKGFRLAGEAGPAGAPQIVFEGTGVYPKNRCMDYRDFECVHEDKADVGALIVVFPEDDASAEQVHKIGDGAMLVFSSNSPSFCTREGSWFRSLHAISSQFSLNPLPDRWMCLDVYKKTSQAGQVQNHL